MLQAGYLFKFYSIPQKAIDYKKGVLTTLELNVLLQKTSHQQAVLTDLQIGRPFVITHSKTKQLNKNQFDNFRELSRAKTGALVSNLKKIYFKISVN